MKIIPYNEIVVKDRQRKKIATSPLNELKESIIARGLLHPPTIRWEEDKPVLVAGERRYRAIALIHKEQKTFECNTQIIAIGECPVLETSLSALVDLRHLELDENTQREELTWQEKAQALADIHALRQGENPKQTYVETAKEIAKPTGLAPDYLRQRIQDAVNVAANLHNPKIANARSFAEANSALLRQEEEKLFAETARRRLLRMGGDAPALVVRHGDLLEVLPSMDPSQADLILTDPPYGIEASSGGFRQRTVHHHDYVDDVDTSRLIQKTILTEGFRLTKERANLFMFTDIQHWEWLQRISAQIGWTPFRRPMIWGKSDSEGLAPWGSQGPRITTEFIFFATKGRKGLLASPIDYLRVNRVPRNERIHAAQKPVELLRQLIECSTLPGDMVLDPCCGSGSTLVAARESKRRAIGIERDEDFYHTAMANIHGDGNGQAS